MQSGLRRITNAGNNRKEKVRYVDEARRACGSETGSTYGRKENPPAKRVRGVLLVQRDRLSVLICAVSDDTILYANAWRAKTVLHLFFLL